MQPKICPVPQKLKLLVTIVKRDAGDHVAAFLRERGISYNLIAPAYGAFGLELRDYLGFSETEKDIVISVATEGELPGLLSAVNEEFSLDEPDTGISFTIPLAGISGPQALMYVTGFAEKETDAEMSREEKHHG